MGRLTQAAAAVRVDPGTLRDELRLPIMVITTWVESAEGCAAGGTHPNLECLERRLPLLNVETEILGRRIALI